MVGNEPQDEDIRRERSTIAAVIKSLLTAGDDSCLPPSPSDRGREEEEQPGYSRVRDEDGSVGSMLKLLSGNLDAEMITEPGEANSRNQTLTDEIKAYKYRGATSGSLGNFVCHPMYERIEQLHARYPDYSVAGMKRDLPGMEIAVKSGDMSLVFPYTPEKRKDRLEYAMGAKMLYGLVQESRRTEQRDEEAALAYILETVPDEFDLEENEFEEYLEW